SAEAAEDSQTSDEDANLAVQGLDDDDRASLSAETADDVEDAPAAQASDDADLAVQGIDDDDSAGMAAEVSDASEGAQVSEAADDANLAVQGLDDDDSDSLRVVATDAAQDSDDFDRRVAQIEDQSEQRVAADTLQPSNLTHMTGQER